MTSGIADRAEPARRHEATWHPVGPSLPLIGQLSGLDFLSRIVDRRVPPPPFAAILGFALVEVGEGRAIFAMTPGEQHYNPVGTVHGGMAATLIDSATGCAVYTTLAPGDRWATSSINVNLVRAMTAATGPIRCIGTVVHAGSRLATAEARIVDETGTLYAHGGSTCMIQRAVKP